MTYYRISEEEADAILQQLREDDSFQHDVFGKIEDSVRDCIDGYDEEEHEDQVYDQAIDEMIEKLRKDPNIWDEYLNTNKS